MAQLFRALAQFVMQGKLQASVIAILGIPVISPAAVALVLMRLGSSPGAIVFIAAVAPGLVLFASSVANALMAMVSTAIYLAIAIAALVLRQSQSWSYALGALLGLTVVNTIVMFLGAPSQVAAITNAIAETSRQMVAQYGTEAQAPLQVTDRYTLGMIATVSMFAAIPSLLLARWWQALLYNPGGFQKEFHLLRFGPVLAVVCLGVGLYHYSAGEPSWGAVFFMPLVVAGIGLVHWMVKQRGLGSHWLIVFYIFMLLVGPMRGMIAVLAVLDSLLNLRGRVAPRSQD